MKKTMECTNCGAAAPIVRGRYQFKDLGLRNVTLRGVELARCPRCGNEDAILPGVNRIMRAVALALVGKPNRLRGDEVRFLRSFLGMPAEKFAKLVHVDKATLSKWENDEDPVGVQSDLLIRMFTLALGDGLSAKAEAMVKGFEHISARRKPVRIEVQAGTLEYEYA
jgi:DNA-binding transcriptional regulator YiaG